MRKHLKIATIVGARPNFVKVAPLFHAIEAHNKRAAELAIDHVLIHTGQHYDDAMSAQFFQQFELPEPHHYLGVGSGTHAEQTGQTMIRLEPVLKELQPDWVVVVGDVNAALAGAVTAKKLLLKVAHIESGLRSNDWQMPEEVNRVIVDRISDLLLTTSDFADRNLLGEGVDAGRIVRVGNIMIDSLRKFADRAENVSLKTITGRELHNEPFVLATIHRPSNVDDRHQLQEIVSALVDVAGDSPVVLPLHPRTRQALQKSGLMETLASHGNMIILNPLPHLELLALQQCAAVIVTDSGGLQEEAMILGTPCVTLRTTTERPETLRENGGTSRLAPLDRAGITFAVREARRESRRPVDYPLWDGCTAERIVAALVGHA